MHGAQLSMADNPHGRLRVGVPTGSPRPRRQPDATGIGGAVERAVRVPDQDLAESKTVLLLQLMAHRP